MATWTDSRTTRAQSSPPRGLRRLAPLAESAGVTLLLELLNSRVDHPDYAGDHMSWGLEVLAQTEAENVKLLYDIYHMQVMEGGSDPYDKRASRRVRSRSRRR